MKIGMTYDILSDYGFNTADLTFADFASETTITHIKRALEFHGHRVELIGNLPKLFNRITTNTLECDMIFNIAEGLASRNREGLIPALLECRNVPFTGSDAYALSLTLNKLHTKVIAQHLGIKTPAYSFIPFQTPCEQIGKMVANLLYPVVVKPNREGSSMGIYVVHNEQECVEAILSNFADYKQDVLCEEYIDGLEVTVPILGTMEDSTALGISSYTGGIMDGSSANCVYSTEMKYFDDVHCYIPAIPEKVKNEIIESSLTLHKHLQCNDYNRIDYKISSAQVPYLLEVNPLPSLSPQGSFETCANHQGMEYHDVIDHIVTSAQRRNSLGVTP